MCVFIEFLNSIRTNKFVVICCLVSFVSTLDPKKEEERIAKLYKDEREVVWKWKMGPICKSTFINKEVPGSSWEAYINEVSVLLPLADCNVIQMEILTCAYKYTNEQRILVRNAESYVYSHTDEKIYTFDLKRNKEQCNGAPVDIIEYKEEIGLGYELIPIEYPGIRNEMQIKNDWKVAEELIVESEEGRMKGLWTWEMKPFCESTTISKQFPGSLWSAYVVNVNVVLPSFNCNVAQVETLTCVHRYTNEQGILVWNEESYVDSQLHGPRLTLWFRKRVRKPKRGIYTFNLRRNKDECNGIPLNLIEYEERISSAHGLEPIKSRVDYGQLPFIDPRRLVDDSEKKLADFYEANKTTIEWKWEIAPFCESQSEKRSFLGANITKGQIVLPKADCALVEMEILNCEYNGKMGWTRKFYVNGHNHDIFTLGSVGKHSKCGEKRYPEHYYYWDMKYKVATGERRPITSRSSKGKSIFDSKFLGGTSKANATQNTVNIGGSIYL